MSSKLEFFLDELEKIIAEIEHLMSQINLDEKSQPKAFVVHWTDYSPGRAKPLDRDVRPLADEASALAMAEQFIEQNIKKGWQPVK